MTNKVTLDDIRRAAEARYGSYDIDLADGFTVSLLNPLRLTAEARQKLQSLEDIGESGDTEGVLIDTVRTLAATPAQAERLIAEVNGDLAVLATIIEQYGENTQAGEA